MVPLHLVPVENEASQEPARAIDTSAKHRMDTSGKQVASIAASIHFSQFQILSSSPTKIFLIKSDLSHL
jgi:hypothetical protein